MSNLEGQEPLLARRTELALRHNGATRPRRGETWVADDSDDQCRILLVERRQVTIDRDHHGAVRMETWRVTTFMREWTQHHACGA